ncbi:MAG: hypothetical protein QOE76_4048 [Frankiales bacterium]|nr:hypothetical protein [Frankiales bacterium]
MRRNIDTYGQEQLLQAESDGQSCTYPEDRGDQPHRERLDQHRGKDLPLAGAERTQQSVLTGSLSDRDREGVEHHESADEHGDPREDEQEGGEKRQRLAYRALRLGGYRVPGNHLGAGRQRCRHSVDEFALRHPWRGDEVDAVVLARRCDQQLGYGCAEGDDAGAPGGVGVAEAGDARDPHEPWWSLDEDGRGVADT